MTFRYEFNNPRTGKRCCGNDDPDPKYFCDNCKAQLIASGHASGTTRHAASFRTTSAHAGKAHTPTTDVEYLRAFGGVRTAPPPDAANPYAAAMKNAEATCPCNSPGYEPYGVPPDGYALALKRRAEATR